MHTNQGTMVQICTNYYSRLYTARESPTAMFRAQNAILCYVEDKLVQNTKNKLQALMSGSELQATLFDMQLDKSPGPDGIVMEFYRTFWDLINEEYIEMVNESIRMGKLPRGVTQGIIVLLHKGGDRKTLINWRSITLLNLGSKFYAKALQLRL